MLLNPELIPHLSVPGMAVGFLKVGSFLSRQLSEGGSLLPQLELSHPLPVFLGRTVGLLQDLRHVLLLLLLLRAWRSFLFLRGL